MIPLNEGDSGLGRTVLRQKEGKAAASIHIEAEMMQETVGSRPCVNTPTMAHIHSVAVGQPLSTKPWNN